MFVMVLLCHENDATELWFAKSSILDEIAPGRIMAAWGSWGFSLYSKYDRSVVHIQSRLKDAAAGFVPHAEPVSENRKAVSEVVEACTS